MVELGVTPFDFWEGLLGGVLFSDSGILKPVGPVSGGITKSSGKGDNILGRFKGFSGDIEALVLDPFGFLSAEASFLGGGDAREGAAAGAFRAVDGFCSEEASDLRGTGGVLASACSILARFSG